MAYVNAVSVLSRDVSGNELHQDVVDVGALVDSAVKVCTSQILDVSLKASLEDSGTSGHILAAAGIYLTATATTTLPSFA